MKLIEAKNISYKINDRNILNNISFVINFGELVKISGDNGSGKTTLLKIINHNEDKVCFLGHKNNLKNYLSIRENLMIQGLKLDSFNLDLLEKFNLRRHIDNSVGTLSFGQQKKLSLIRVLNSVENILILDEPFVGLDQKSKEFLKDFMEAEVKKNKTIIFTSHIDFKDDYREIKING
jgi:ABC-type transport system involved in cytochrome c biogenesis ATPase subunit